MSHGTRFPTATAPLRARAGALALGAVLLLAGCGPTPRTTSPPDAGAQAVHPAATPEVPTEPAHRVPAALAGRARAPLAVYDAPHDPTPSQTLPAATAFGTQTVVLVSDAGTGPEDGWLEVLLPVRPNGATGWIRSGDVELRDVTLAVDVDLASRELRVFDGGKELLTTAAAIGDPDHPTPTGRFYVIDKLETPDPAGAYGPYALGLSAHSDVLTQFGGGDGQIGIHGTNAPTSVGQPVSHGCLRVDNDVIERLARLLPLGTPVTIS